MPFWQAFGVGGRAGADFIEAIRSEFFQMRHAVLAPIEPGMPSAAGFAGIPFALAVNASRPPGANARAGLRIRSSAQRALGRTDAAMFHSGDSRSSIETKSARRIVSRHVACPEIDVNLPRRAVGVPRIDRKMAL